MDKLVDGYIFVIRTRVQLPPSPLLSFYLNMGSIDKIERHIAKVEYRAEINDERRKKRWPTLGDDISVILNERKSELLDKGESPDAIRDVESLIQQQKKLEAAAARTDPKKVKNN